MRKNSSAAAKPDSFLKTVRFIHSWFVAGGRGYYNPRLDIIRAPVQRSFLLQVKRMSTDKRTLSDFYRAELVSCT